jgi:teichoic acid glycerol-phosphate primase
MVREIAVFLYLRLISILFASFRFFQVQRKVVFVASFADNNVSIYQEMQRQGVNCRTVFLTTRKAHPHFAGLTGADKLLFDIRHFPQFVTSIYHLATAKVVFVDNYYGFLAAASFKEETKCIQLWHANGAVKKFGLEDHSTEARSENARKRFRQVYDRFDHVVVSSDAMAQIFQKAFGLSGEKILKTGVPRTDVFFSKDAQKQAAQKVYQHYPQLAGKKVVLYAPTYREEQLDSFELRLNLDLLKKELGTDYALLLRLHPAIKNSVMLNNDLKDFVFDVSGYPSLNDLLFITDLLISDYSSIPFEFSLLNKPMLFFPYDLTHYSKTRGLWEDYHQLVPGPVVLSTAEIIKAIRHQEFDYDRLKGFNHKWNEYAHGESSQNIVAFAKAHLGLEVTEQVKVQSDLSH